MDSKSKQKDKPFSWRYLFKPRRPSSYLNPLDQQGTTSNPSGQGGTTSSSSMDTHSQSSPSSRRLHRYDVFISFRGPDTRNTFVDHLYNHLIRKGIFVFKDDIRLQKGESISPQLLQAIQDSRLSIVVFSENYPESTWCLDELAAIAECRKDLKQIVFPVFYDVDPSHVRNQSGHYGTIFDSLVKRLDIDIPKLLRWMEAMRDLAGSAGWDVRNKPEFGEIQNIIQVVIKKLGHKFSRFANDLIGIQPRVQALESLLKLNSEDDGFPILGIRGMGGIGKTTLANVLYDRISYQFDACCFIENVSKIYKDGGAIAVQKQILRQTIDEKHLETCSPSEISGIVNNRLHNIKVLVVLDNVDQLEQLKELAINPTLLHTGSRMIITTRDEHILKVYGAHVVHEVSLLNYDEAHEFFCKNAFKPEDQNNNCVELIPEVLQYAQGLPLAIKVVGSFLCTRDATQWRDALDRLHKNPKKEIMDVLQVSIDGLQHEEKEIFLHIACFFKGEREDYVKRILDACELHPHIGIQSMIEKSLITIRNEEIHMHDMLQELGKKIVRDQCPGKPGSWSRLWLYKDFYHVLMTESGTDNVEAIVLDQKEKENVLKCSAEGFSKMKSLKLLILYDENFSEIPNFLSNNLLYLLWHGYPFPFLPPKFEPYYLVELNLPHSSIQHLWKGCKQPCYFRCGFDIVAPWDWKNIDSSSNPIIPTWFDHRFDGGSIIRITMHSDENDEWMGFAFCVAFEVNNGLAIADSPHHPSSSSLPLPHPFYLSFESEHTEERFDMPLSLELDKIDGSKHLWIVYISRQHCHFIKTGARITFKARPGLIMKQWGLRKVDANALNMERKNQHLLSAPRFNNNLVIENVKESSSSVGPKIQLPYNWLVSDEDEVENYEAKGKENNLSNLGL